MARACSDAGAIVNDAALPKPGMLRRKLNRVVDQIAFGLIKHCLSRAHHQRFDGDALARYAADWMAASIDDFYALPDFPESEANAALLKKNLFPFRPRFELSLDSPIRSGHPENDRVWLDFHLCKPVDQAPIFVILHGWRSVSVKGYHQVCRRLNELGINAIITHLPFHFSRTPKRCFNGELAISADLVRSGNGLRHGVLEMRWLCRELKNLGAPAFGLWGTSYGGWIGAMTALVEPKLDALLMLEPPVEIEKIFWEVPLFEKLTGHLQKNGVSRGPIQHLFDLVTPYKHRPKIDTKKIVMLGSLYDSIATPESLQLLNRSWPGTHLEIFPYAHISYRLHLAAIRLFEERLLPQIR
jgi:alpha/beta hydrolase family protein